MTETRILAVDDDPRNLDVVEAILEPLGKPIVRARSGADALRCCLEMDFAVIVLDVMMPGLDGYQTAALIRGRERSSATPIIFLTASTATDAAQTRGYEAGAVDYLTKPIVPFVLRSKVAVFVELHERAETMRRQEQQLRDLEAREQQRRTEELVRRERERADLAVREAIERQALILRAVPLIVYEADPAPPHAVKWISDNIERVAGCTVPECLATEDFWAARIHPDDREAVGRALAAAAPGAWSASEYRWRRADGAYRCLLDQFSLSATSPGLPVIVGTRLDITDRKQAEQALDETERRFRQAQKMEAVGRLAGGVAHDFNNLITAVLGFGQFALEALPEGDRVRADVQEVVRAGERAATLTRQLLAFSRQSALDPRVVDLNTIVDGADRMLRRVVGEDVDLAIAARAAPALVKVDPGQVEQVIMNLVVNARDAMPGGGQLRIETGNAAGGMGGAGAADLPPGAYVRLSVSDSGCGMPPETLAHLFEPFFTTKEAGKGTGLGLSTVYGIVQQSGGNIHVRSEVNRGTTFTIYLPLTTEPADLPRDAGAAGARPAGSETILLVEDDAQLRAVTESILARSGYTVITATNGRDALKVVGDRPIDLLLTDVVMPHVGGRELAERLAKARPGLKVLFVSGYTDRGVDEGLLRQTGWAFLAKPFSPDTLAQHVRRLLG